MFSLKAFESIFIKFISADCSNKYASSCVSCLVEKFDEDKAVL